MATWIWYFGDFEIHQLMLLDSRRDERGFMRPAPWRLDDCWHNVYFTRTYELEKDERITVRLEGVGNICINGKYSVAEGEILLKKGTNHIKVELANTEGLPSLYIKGDAVQTDGSWKVSCYDLQEVNAGYWNFDSIDAPPSSFTLPTREIQPESSKKIDGGYVIDAGKQTFSKVLLQFAGEGMATIYYGESVTEVMSGNSYIHETVNVAGQALELVPRAFRYLYIKTELELTSLRLLFEYLPLSQLGSFHSSDALLDQIYDVSVYTMFLNSREFFLDGIKRDRYVWSGDAYQSYLMNYYLYFDSEICKRTMIALAGKAPVCRHINTIMDYTFYWFISIMNHYYFTGDKQFLENIYPTMVMYMDFCLGRMNDEHLMGPMPGDWIFVDWAEIDKEGETCAEQILFVKALEAMNVCCDVLGKDGSAYRKLEEEVREKIEKYYWDEEKGAYINSFRSGRRDVTKHPNIFALLFGLADSARREVIKNNVIQNPAIAPITTPYFRFYELETMSVLGEYGYVLDSIRDYWGGMLKLGATTFWEEYKPDLSGDAHYAMYGDDFGKSLCHAWGASPIYLLGRYFVGVTPTSTGYETFDVTPHLGDLEWFEGVVPVNGGQVTVYLSKETLKVTATKEGGTLRFNGQSYPLEKDKEFELSFT